MPTGRENTISQMKELIAQNYNHASIVVWGLSNEITMKGDSDPDLLENHKILNDICHQMDKTRLTTIAAVSMCPMESPYLQIPDVVSYNHYFG
jgi:beta-galactosidase